MLYKTISLIVFTILCSCINAQTHRFFYNVEFKEDSTTTNTTKLSMILDVNPKETKYYSYNMYQKDSINKATNNTNTNWSSLEPIIRNRNSTINTNYRGINHYVYTYQTDDKINWKLSNETKTLQNYTLQKATADFGGRHWTAWFTKDIPLSEGPYKFQGLPGLIVQLYDSQMQYNFSLAKNINLSKTYDTSDFLENRIGNKPLSVSEKNFRQKQLEYFNDPFHEQREWLSTASSTASFEYYGRVFTRNNISDLVPVIKEQQARMRRENNPIERNKAIKYPTK